MYRLSDEDIQKFVALPELGMGYQFVRRGATRQNFNYGILINGALLLSADDLKNGDVMARLRKASLHGPDRELLTELDVASSVQLSEDCEAYRSFSGVSDSTRWAGDGTIASLHHSPPHYGVLKHSSLCLRFSAFENDRRLLADGVLSADSYVTTFDDGLSALNGTTAWAKYALPTPIPATWLSAFEVTIGAEYRFGPVAPAFGQSGGGIEIKISIGARLATPGDFNPDIRGWNQGPSFARREPISAKIPIYGGHGTKYPFRLPEL